MPGVIIAIVFVFFIIRVIASAVKQIKKAEEAERRRRASLERLQAERGQQGRPQGAYQAPSQQQVRSGGPARPPVSRPGSRRRPRRGRHRLVTRAAQCVNERSGERSGSDQSAPRRPQGRRGAGQPGDHQPFARGGQAP